MGKSSGGTRNAVSANSRKMGGVTIGDASAEYIDRANGVKRQVNRAAQQKLWNKAEKEAMTPVIGQNWTKSEENALSHYTSSGYITVNEELRSGKMSAKTKKTVEAMDRVLSKNILKEDVIVYRGTSGKYSGKDAAYTSTSTSVTNASAFARGKDATIRAYRIPKGTKAIWIGSGERELILPRNFDMEKYRIR